MFARKGLIVAIPPPRERTAINELRWREDIRLARLAAGGDAEAMRMIVMRLMPQVEHVAKALFRDPATAADASQSAMVEVMRSIGGYSATASLGTWAHRIAVRVAFRIIRSQRQRDEREGTEIELDSIPVFTDERLAEDVPRPVWAYLDLLSEPLRQVLVLRHVLGYGIDEIAEITQVSPNSVKDRLLRAREHVNRLIRRDRAIGAPR